MSTENNIRYEPLRNVLNAFESDIQSHDPEELKRCLIERGYDPEKSISEVKKLVSSVLHKRRLSWQEAAERKITQLKEKASKAIKWTNKSPEEIEKAFAAIASGEYGPHAQLKLSVAWRNLKEVSVDDKAAFLDSLEILTTLGSNAKADDEIDV